MALPYCAVDDDTAADAGAQSGQHHTLAACAAAAPVLAQGGHVGVVAGLDRQAGQLAQGLMEVEHAPAQVDAAVDDAVVGDGTGHADADADDVLLADAVAFQAVIQGLCDIREDVLAVFDRAGRDLPMLQKVAHVGEEAELDGGAAHVCAESVFHRFHLFFPRLGPALCISDFIINHPKKKCYFFLKVILSFCAFCGNIRIG